MTGTTTGPTTGPPPRPVTPGPGSRVPAAGGPGRRGTEFFLLLVAVLLCVSGYLVVGLTLHGAPPPDTLRYAAGLGVLVLLAHGAVRLTAPYADPLLLPIAVLLNGMGLVLIHRLDQETPHDQAAGSQLVWSARAPPCSSWWCCWSATTGCCGGTPSFRWRPRSP